ncbi:hypothetical protein G6F43_012718 [Rhizopus delemar]|nr:hypothetical protein G6F43_012718 [Rhizopus delemar]
MFTTLGILDPTVQQQALQFRWLTPLLQQAYPLNLAPKWISAHITSIAPTAVFDHRLPFLFPALRHGLLHQHRPGICSMLFRAFDNLFDSSAITSVLNTDLDKPDVFPLALSLDLPLSAVIQWTDTISTKEQRSFDDILVREAFELVPTLDCLRPKALLSDRINITYGRYRVQKLLRWVMSSTVCLLPFFARLCLPVTSSGPVRLSVSLGLNPLFQSLVDPVLNLISSKFFRQTRLKKIVQTFPLSSPVRQRSSRLWKTFWQLQIPLAIRTPWYRLLQRKFPCAKMLHGYVPDLCEPTCRLCMPRAVTEHVDHFLFLCPRKRRVWEQVWSHFFGFPCPLIWFIKRFIFCCSLPND